jgi:hypothetical protein
MHSGAIGIEDPAHLDKELMLPVIIEEKRFSAPFAFVVT